MTSIGSQDDYLHLPDQRKKWRESYYFNWVDQNNEISGFTTIGILPNELKREFVFVLFYKDNLKTIHYQEISLDPKEENLDLILSDGTLSYHLISPLERWKIEYIHDSIIFRIEFNSRFSTYDFGLNSSASWHGHFEISGIINGTVELVEEKVKLVIKGYGQRDKSWGYRDWHTFDQWYAGHIQYSDYVIGFRKDYQKGQIKLSGFINANNFISPLESVTITITDFEKDEYNTPLAYICEIKNALGKVLKFRTERLGEQTSFRFTRQFAEGYTELFEQMVLFHDLDTGEIGTGMVEYLRTFRLD